mgnify:CR=1 FL=1
MLRELWGDWPQCKQRLARSHRRSIVTFLDDRPGDFKGAWARVNQDLRSLYLAAFQSHLWNELLAAWIRERVPPGDLVDVPLKLGPAHFVRALDAARAADLQRESLPLPSARIRLHDLNDASLRELLQPTLARRGLELRMIRVKYPRDTFFSKGWRPPVIPVEGLAWSHEPDELHPGRFALRLKFDLRRGSYATILIKRITDAAGLSSDEVAEQLPQEDAEPDDNSG